MTFSVWSGGGSVTGAAAVTGDDGIATVGSWTLGSAAGANSLRATCAGVSGSPVTFTATGVFGPPTDDGAERRRRPDGRGRQHRRRRPERQGHRRRRQPRLRRRGHLRGGLRRRLRDRRHRDHQRRGYRHRRQLAPGHDRRREHADGHHCRPHRVSRDLHGHRRRRRAEQDADERGQRPDRARGHPGHHPAERARRRRQRQPGRRRARHLRRAARRRLGHRRERDQRRLGDRHRRQLDAGHGRRHQHPQGDELELRRPARDLHRHRPHRQPHDHHPVRRQQPDGHRAGTAVATAPSVRVTDVYNNPVTGVAVTFAVASGGGSVTGATTTTNASGIATVGSWTLGTRPGPTRSRRRAPASPARRCTFTATGTAGPATQVRRRLEQLQPARQFAGDDHGAARRPVRQPGRHRRDSG